MPERVTTAVGLPVGTGFFASSQGAAQQDMDEESSPLASVFSQDLGVTGVLTESASVKVGKARQPLFG